MSNVQELKNRVNELLNYDPASGLFTWKISRQRVRVGKIAGVVISNGYVKVEIDGKMYYAHRLAWLVTTGTFPVADLDHVDGNKANSAITNLREATRSQNMCNMQKRCNNTSNYVGVSWHIRAKKWMSSLCCGNVKYHIGYFNSAEDAAIARDMAAMKTHLQFAKLNFRYEIFRNNEIKVI